MALSPAEPCTYTAPMATCIPSTKWPLHLQSTAGHQQWLQYTTALLQYHTKSYCSYPADKLHRTGISHLCMPCFASLTEITTLISLQLHLDHSRDIQTDVNICYLRNLFHEISLNGDMPNMDSHWCTHLGNCYRVSACWWYYLVFSQESSKQPHFSVKIHHSLVDLSPVHIHTWSIPQV